MRHIARCQPRRGSGILSRWVCMGQATMFGRDATRRLFANRMRRGVGRGSWKRGPDGNGIADQGLEPVSERTAFTVGLEHRVLAGGTTWSPVGSERVHRCCSSSAADIGHSRSVCTALSSRQPDAGFEGEDSFNLRFGFEAFNSA